MNDMNSTIIAKSDQLNSDDLISGAITIRIRDTKVASGGEQPVSIFYEGDNNKPWKPCKSMARVLVAAWGANSKAYIGKSLTLFRDASVKWAGMEVGGIRITHMSDIGGDQTIPITVTRGNKKPYLVKPLKTEPKPSPAKPAPKTDWNTVGAGIAKKIAECKDAVALADLIELSDVELLGMETEAPKVKARIDELVAEKKKTFVEGGAE